MQLSAQEIAKMLNGSVEGDPRVMVSYPSKIEEGGEGAISFLGNPKYEEYVYTTTASVLLVGRDFKPKQPVRATLIRVDDVYAAVALLLNELGDKAKPAEGISLQASIHPSAVLGARLSIGSFAVIEAGAVIGDDTIIYPQAFIGKNVEIGKNVIIYPGVRILYNCRIGDNCIIHPNVVIGSDGFGFAPTADGSYKKINHVGNVVLEENVEVGANTTIDRATMGATIVKSGAKLDNLIQLGHNVIIGKDTVIAAQVGIAGSTKIGDSCRIGGQAGFVGHITVADGAQVQAQSGVASPVKKPNSALFGSPAIDYKNYVRSYAVFKQLPDLLKRIKDLERKLKKKNS